VIVLTWNANNRDRWGELWRDQFVIGNNWEAVFLQEAGNPDPAWTQLSGPAWRANTHEDVVFRTYRYVDILGRTIYIAHCEWVRRQKNHTVMITKAPARPISIAGDVGIRPCLGTHIRLRYPDNSTKTAILGCVHIVSSYKAATEVAEMTQVIDEMVRQKRADGWLLFGDFNAQPDKIAQEANCKTTYFPGQTHKTRKGYPLDYGAFSKMELLQAQTSTWYQGPYLSDHRIMKYEQTGGPTISFL
jgi:hypothetical protein